MKNVLMIVGSLREGSFNRQLAFVVEELFAKRARVTYLDWEDLPLMNQDIEDPVPAPVQRVRDQVCATDGIWICSPEYNASIPGGEKNLLDWLSRPLDPTDQMSSVLVGKNVAMAGVGGKAATAGMRANMEKLLSYMGMEVVGGMGFGATIPPGSWETGLLELTQSERDQLAGLCNTFLQRLG